MDNLLEYNNKVSLIYGNPGKINQETESLSHHEFVARTSSFLGKDYDSKKLQQVEDLEALMRFQHEQLCRRSDAGDLSASEFTRNFATILQSIYSVIEVILGEEDFLTLYGSKPKIAAEFILETSLATTESTDNGRASD
ncbi:hypothetical protein [Leisingera aquaemixtae]|uniref:hypothetical protein n=1 Tax=Leisingera aquaemixtae TaxID=1396826 RepID=UPI0021A7C6C6|nr:hypothetical protein [Leisingera aquaemixtae]UWQ44398.1 hypothetical protein K3719_11355 [Leisingera aquaemixtae]